MRYRTAAILSVVLVGGMFSLPAAVWAVFLPSLREGLPTPIPGYEKFLLGIAVFCQEFRFLLAIPIVAVLFTIANFTSQSRIRKRVPDPRSSR